MAARLYVGADCCCPFCGVTFPNRPKVLTNLAELRSRGKDTRPTCGQLLASSRWAPLPHKVVEELDVADRQLRADAQRRGWTQPRSLLRGQAVAPAPSHLPAKRLRHKTSHLDIVWALKRRKVGYMNAQ